MKLWSKILVKRTVRRVWYGCEGGIPSRKCSNPTTASGKEKFIFLGTGGGVHSGINIFENGNFDFKVISLYKGAFYEF